MDVLVLLSSPILKLTASDSLLGNSVSLAWNIGDGLCGARFLPFPTRPGIPSGGTHVVVLVIVDGMKVVAANSQQYTFPD
jgi:hypothetical protein